MATGTPAARSSTLKNLAWFAAYNLLFGLRAGVDNMAHLGGFASGIALGAAIACGTRIARRGAGRTSSAGGRAVAGWRSATPGTAPEPAGRSYVRFWFLSIFFVL